MAPTLFGHVSVHLFPGPGSGTGTGLEYTLLIFLFALVAAGLLGLVAARTYPRDLATAEASTRRIQAAHGPREGAEPG